MKNNSLILIQVFLFAATLLIYTLPVSAKQACIRSKNENVTCGELIEPNRFSAPVDSSKTIKTKSGINFTLEGCQKISTGVICSILVYNSTDYDKKILLHDSTETFLIDSEGSQYRMRVRNFSQPNASYPALLPLKATKKAQLFSRPSGNLTNYIRVLQVHTVIEGNNLKFTFRDININ